MSESSSRFLIACVVIPSSPGAVLRLDVVLIACLSSLIVKFFSANFIFGA